MGLLARPRSGMVAALVATAFFLPMVGAAIQTFASATCCCPLDDQETCACSVCAHARELKSPRTALRSCRAAGGPQALLPLSGAAMPVIWMPAAPLPRPFRAREASADRPSAVFPEVPTPPPLS